MYRGHSISREDESAYGGHGSYGGNQPEQAHNAPRTVLRAPDTHKRRWDPLWISPSDRTSLTALQACLLVLGILP